jgi:hypothetical protein
MLRRCAAYDYQGHLPDKEATAMNKNPVFGTTERQIGNTRYVVNTMPSEGATETAEQMLVRLVKDRIADDRKSQESLANAGIIACNHAVSMA